MQNERGVSGSGSSLYKVSRGFIVDLFSPIIAIEKAKHVSGEVNIDLVGLAG